jgi:hypothetical protein
MSKLKDLNYEEKKKVFGKLFSMGFLTESLSDKLVLISLVALVSNKLKAKDSTLDTLSILLKIAEYKEDDSSYYSFLESLAIIVDDFSYGIDKYDPCGLSSSDEIIKKIKTLLHLWLPF